MSECRRLLRSGDVVGYTGSDPGVMLAVPAGSLIVFSSLALHGSGDNISLLPRRALNLAFTQQHEQEEPKASRAGAVPFLEDGKVVSLLCLPSRCVESRTVVLMKARLRPRQAPSAERLRSSVSAAPTDSLVLEYREAGFVVVPQVFSGDELAEIIAAVDRRTAEARQWYAADTAAARGPGTGLQVAGEGRHAGEVSSAGDKMFERHASDRGDALQVRALFRLHEDQDDSDGFFRRLLEHPRMVALARRLLGQDVVPSMVQFIDKAPHTSYEFPYHQDNACVVLTPMLSGSQRIRQLLHSTLSLLRSCVVCAAGCCAVVVAHLHLIFRFAPLAVVLALE